MFAKEDSAISIGRREFLGAAAATALIGGGMAAGGGQMTSPAAAQPAIDLDQLTATQTAADLCAGKITSKALTLSLIHI